MDLVDFGEICVVSVLMKIYLKMCLFSVDNDYEYIENAEKLSLSFVRNMIFTLQRYVMFCFDRTIPFPSLKNTNESAWCIKAIFM